MVQKQNKQTIKNENPFMAKGVVVEETEVFTYPTAPFLHLCICLLTSNLWISLESMRLWTRPYALPGVAKG